MFLACVGWSPSASKRLVFFVTEDWYFCSHRLPVARAARAAGFDVHVITRLGSAESDLRGEGFTIHPIAVDRSGINPLRDLVLLLNVAHILFPLRPMLLHNVGLKPVLYGSLAARLLSGIRPINALAGLGFVYSSLTLKARLLKPLVRMVLKIALNTAGGHAILQNDDDRNLLIESGTISSSRTTLIRGSGVDVNVFRPVLRASSRDVPVVAMPARLLRDKGVYEFVAAARILMTRKVPARFVLIGAPDESNPSSVSNAECAAWTAEGVVELWGWRRDMASTLREVDIVALPSYREGLPKCLLEAASCGLPIVTTDVPGCRDVVIDGENGFLVPLKSIMELSVAIERLLRNPSLRQKMGLKGRQIVIDNFAESIVVDKTMALYAEMARLDG